MKRRDQDRRQLSLWADETEEVTPPRAPTASPHNLDQLPDVRDGLTREQRVILYALYEAQKERPGRNVPTLMLYGRVTEYMPMSKDRFQQLLSNLVGRGVPKL